MPDEVISGRISAAGTAVLKYKPTGRQLYIVRQVSHDGTIPGAIAVGSTAVATLKKNGRLVSRTVAQGGVVAGEPPVELYGGVDTLTLEYSAAAVGASVEMMVFYDDPKPL